MRVKSLVAAGLLAFGPAAANAADVFKESIYDPAPMAQQSLPMVSGNVVIHVGLGDISDCRGCDFWSYGGGGSALIRANDMWGVQIDAHHTSFDFDDGPTFGNGHVAAHLTYDHIGHFRLGAFAGVQDGGFSTGFIGGVEGQVHFGQWILEGQVGFADHDGYDYWYLYGGVDYFFTRNTRVNLNLGFADMDADRCRGCGADLFTIGGYAEHKFAARPYGVFASIEHTEIDPDGCCGDPSATSGLVGFKIYFNQNDIAGEEENGTAFAVRAPRFNDFRF